MNEAVKSLHRKHCFLLSFFRVNEREMSLASKVFLCELKLLHLFLNASVLEKKGNDSLRGSGLLVKWPCPSQSSQNTQV